MSKSFVDFLQFQNMIEESKRCLFGGMIPATKASKPALVKSTKTEQVKMNKIVPKTGSKVAKSVKKLSSIKIGLSSEKFESPIKRVDSLKQVTADFCISIRQRNLIC